MERRIMITVTKKDLIALGYGTSFSADIIRKAKKLMIEKGYRRNLPAMVYNTGKRKHLS